MINQVLISAAGLGIASLLGSAIGLLIKKISHRLNDIFLGFCAGMMLAASIVCLIMPAIEMVSPIQWWQIIAGVAAGVGLICALDYVTPHLHHLTGIDPEIHHSNKASINRILLFVLAIAIHKLPEGMATGIVFEGGNEQNALAVSLSIALQNIPEGMVVVTPLLMIGVGYFRTTFVAFIVAGIEVAGVYLGYVLGGLSEVLLPFMLSMAGGAMLYVISDEMIPETHAHGFQKSATCALVIGVMAMLAIRAVTE
ncbi:ZIP family metal transporter [Muribaculum sp.]|jgi:ZIP family zinc transporter|uniref:ZIP family metal transporter n=1 Tax=Muribaculum sp. TaxID=1918611 RepID=UPI002580BA79|nr:ZIP family metal transporter [Muribaculum sp.]